MVRISGHVIAVAVGDSLHLYYTAREYISSIRGFDKTIVLKLCKEYKNGTKNGAKLRHRIVSGIPIVRCVSSDGRYVCTKT